MSRFAAVLWHEPTGKVIDTIVGDTAENETLIRKHWESLGENFHYQWYNLHPAFRKEALSLEQWYALVKYIEKHGGWRKDIKLWQWLDECFIGRV